MKIFLDTANVNEIKEGVALGVVDGVTTNPTLASKEKKPFRPLVEEICRVVPGDVSLEVVATDFEGMVKEGEELAQIAPNVVVKCPLTSDGLKAVKYLTGKGIRVNQTLCFSATQALLYRRNVSWRRLNLRARFVPVVEELLETHVDRFARHTVRRAAAATADQKRARGRHPDSPSRRHQHRLEKAIRLPRARA